MLCRPSGLPMHGNSPATKLANLAEDSIRSSLLQEQVYTTVLSEDSDDDVKDRRHEAATITDLHNSSSIAEVEIISLLEEKIPLYKLRADTATGYAYDDWLGSSLGTVLEEGDNEDEVEEGRYDLSPEMMEETLKYFTLCGDRVVQMTKTYNDIDAVTRLLEEKEKDLELAAKIGQSLLQQNKQLDIRIETLEEQVTVLSDQNTQFRHDIKLKNELLQIYTNDIGYSDSEDDSSCSEKGKPLQQSRFIDVDTLQKKVRTLEEENLYLRIETAELRTSTTSIEEKEQQLMHDCVKQLGESQGRESILGEELSKKYEENARQQEEITSLLAQLVDLSNKVKKLTIENEDMQHHLQAARESQQDLTEEVQDLRDKYEECHEMLLESQEAVKEIHRRSLPQGKVPLYSSLNPLPVFPMDSLAAELVNTVEQELGGEPPLTAKGKRDHQRRVMRTVKAVNRRTHSRQSSLSMSDGSVDFFSRCTSPSSSLMSMTGSPRSEQYEGDNESNYSPVGRGKMLGKAGIPGSNDLEMALRRISLRRQNTEAERKYKEEEKERLLSESDLESGERTPTCMTPSMWSSEAFGYPGQGALNFKAFMPEKLQIVKPMEGSMTLYHWQRLATPHMASMLDSRPGVVVKGFREIEDEEDVFSLDDLEDDGIYRTTVPTKCFVNTSSTYTYTTSNIGLLDSTNLISSTMGPKMTSLPQRSTAANTRTRATSTFSTTTGLAQVLQERDTPVCTAPSVLIKAEASSAPSPRKANMGLNFFTAGRAAEKRAEKSTMPGGVHQVRRGIISRNATPVLSQTAANVLDPETKERLMEKVKAIRAEKEAARRLSMSGPTGIHTVRTPSVTPVISANPPAFKTGVAPGFGNAMSHLSGTTGSTSSIISSRVQPSTGAIPKASTFSTPKSYMSTYPSIVPPPSTGLTQPLTSAYLSTPSAMSSSSLLYASSSVLPSTNVISPSAGLTPPNLRIASGVISSCPVTHTLNATSIRTSAVPPQSATTESLSSVYSMSGSKFASSAMSSPLLYSSSSVSTRTSVIPPGAPLTPPTILSLGATSKASDLGLASVGSMSPHGAIHGSAGVSRAAVGSGGVRVSALSPQVTTGSVGLAAGSVGLAKVGALIQQCTSSNVKRGAVGTGSPQGASSSVGLDAVGALSSQDANSGVGLAAVGALSPLGTSSGVGLAAIGALGPQGVTSPMSVLSGNLNVLKNRHPSGRRL